MGQYSFGIKTSIDFFHKLEDDHNEFLKDPLSSSKALNCAMSAWHLTDWIYVEYYAGQVHSKHFKERIKQECFALVILQDITNGSKHCKITYYVPAVKNTELYQGAFSSGFSRGFDISGHEVTTENGNKLFLEDLIKDAIVYWKSFFAKNFQIQV